MNSPFADNQSNNKIKENQGYQPDLNELLSQCELNYWLVRQLLPDLATTHVQCSMDDLLKMYWRLQANTVGLVFKITDIAPYTTTATLLISTPKIKMNARMEIIIRLYHDAKMLEVMEGTGPSALLPIYCQSKGKGKPVDEKRQINRFIGECLKACFKTMNSQLEKSWS